MILKKLLYIATITQAKALLNKFTSVLKDPVRFQTRHLLSKIKRSRKSDFGRMHKFSDIRTIDDFRQNVPIQSYTDIKPYIDRLIKGDITALFNPGEKIVMFALTSGTTHMCKHIPVTRAFLKEYKRSSLLWGFLLVRDYNFLDQKILVIVSPYDEAKTVIGVPCGAISGLVVATQKSIARRLYILPYWVYAIEDQTEKYYTILRIALTEPDIGLISTANPSTLIKIAQLCNEHKQQLIKDIREGTFSICYTFTSSQRKSIKKFFQPNPDRAEQLQKMVNQYGVLYPKHAWQHIPAIATWTGGVLGHYIDLLPSYYGSVPIRDLGLIASEGRMSIPYNCASSEGILDITGQFFEFIPEEEYENRDKKTLLCNELEVGKNYYIVLTNSAGFFRYDINDLIKVTGFYHNTPVITFLNKGKHISSITGEKISEYQIVNAIHDTLKRLSVELHHYTVSPRWAKIPNYVILLEQEQWMEAVDLQLFIDIFDRSLKQRNMEYNTKRSSGRLAKPHIVIIQNGTFEKMKLDKIRSNNGRSEQYKHVYLNPQIDYHKGFICLKEVTAK